MGRPAPLSALLMEQGDGGAGRDGTDLAATVPRTGEVSSERFCFQEKKKSECQVELLLVPHASLLSSEIGTSLLPRTALLVGGERA